MANVLQRNSIRVVAFNKCGHTSISNMFLTPPDQSVVRGATPAVRISGPDQPPPAEIYKGTTKECAEWPEAKITIAFFRDPLQRAYSAYQHFIIRTLSNTLTGIPSLGRAQFTFLGFKPGMSFLEFCEHMQGIDLNFDDHLKPQSVSFVEACSGMGVVYPLEELSTVWPHLVDKLQLDCTKEVVMFNKANYEPANGLQEARIIDELYAADRKVWYEARETFSSIGHEAFET